MVVYVVVKIRSQIDGLGLIGSGLFYFKDLWSSCVVVLLLNSLTRVVVL